SKLQTSHTRASGSDLSEGAAGQNAIRQAEIRVIGKIERFKPELQRLPFGEVEVLDQREIQRDDARADARGPAYISKRAEWRAEELSGIKPALWILLPTEQDCADAGGRRPVVIPAGVGAVAPSAQGE